MLARPDPETNAAIWGGDIGQGALYGGAFGAVSSFGPPSFTLINDKKWAGTIANRLFNSCLTGAGLEATYAAMSGGNIADGATLGAIGWISGTGFNMIVGHSLGFIMSGKGPVFNNEGVPIYDVSGQQPFSIGGAVIGGHRELYSPHGSFMVIDHEIAHSYGKQKIMGPAYLPAHLISQGISGSIGWIKNETFWNSTHKYNVFERYWHEYPMW